MEVRLGIQHAPRELVMETPLDADEVQQTLSKALGANSDGLFTLESEKGQRVVIPVEKLAYLEVNPDSPNRVGFRT